MLTIKRVPTMVSNYQEEVAGEKVGCGRNCLGNCCLPVSKLPLYVASSDPSSPKSEYFLNSLLLGKWEDRSARGLFRYDVTQCETKTIPGKQGFVAQLNEGRHLKKRPTEFRVDQVLQPFDPAKFNFTKVGQEEVLFQFEQLSHSDKSYYLDCASIDPSRPPNIVAINVSPIEFGHVLLIPRVLDCYPQRIDKDSMALALHMASEANNGYFRLGYNSLGAFATINHLHFQAYYLGQPFPVEKAPVEMIKFGQNGILEDNDLKISKLRNYPVRGLVFEGTNNCIKKLGDLVANSCICLQEKNIPFNFLISDSGRKIFLFPQCYAEKQALGEVSLELLETQVNPAVWEISGHMVLKRRKDYDEASEMSAWRLLAEVSLSEERFDEVKSYIFEAIGLKEEKEGEGEKELGFVAPQHYQEGCIVLQ